MNADMANDLNKIIDKLKERHHTRQEVQQSLISPQPRSQGPLSTSGERTLGTRLISPWKRKKKIENKKKLLQHGAGNTGYSYLITPPSMNPVEHNFVERTRRGAVLVVLVYRCTRADTKDQSIHMS